MRPQRPAKRQRRDPPQGATEESPVSHHLIYTNPSYAAILQPPRGRFSIRTILLTLPAAVAGFAIAYYLSSPNVPGLNILRGSDPFVVADLPGKGKGLVAIRDIQQGELVIQESPLFIVPKSISESPSALISRLLQNVSSADRDAFLNLSYVHFPEGLDPATHPEEVALAIFQTNAVAAGDGVGIFPRMARLNHGCSSAFNVVYTWRQREQALFVHALKNIRKGQELLTTYTDTKRTRKERRSFLEQQYGFRCTCAVCSLDAAASKASDKRLTAISHYYAHLATWGSNAISGAEAISTINKIWKLEDEEGYWSERGRLAADGAWIAASHSDAVAARLWAQLAVKWYTYELGAESEFVPEARTTAEHPEAHPAWGSGAAMPVGRPLD
ncbi:hypothetical protein B0H17DRAFT_930323 [Mycena rosella]|uniref:SET domain-containing protein n=1 Tax=Mycena rosella TaxID=1033263 RepID=A0AAD7DN17_MYCRO|nr:hypothetical protein B0H17DRAFT_930323 [Mycena rosella]